MLRNIIKWVAVVLVFVAGWTAGQIFESWAFFELDNSMNVSDVLGILVECALAVFIVRAITKKDEEKRVEKEFFISEYDKAQEVISELEKECATQNVLSLDVTTYNLSRCRKTVVKIWMKIGELYPGFKKKNEVRQTSLLAKIKSLDSKLTDTRIYKGMKGIDALKIKNRKVYINGTIKPLIDDDISELKLMLLDMKLCLNKM